MSVCVCGRRRRKSVLYSMGTSFELEALYKSKSIFFFLFIIVHSVADFIRNSPFLRFYVGWKICYRANDVYVHLWLAKQRQCCGYGE